MRTVFPTFATVTLGLAFSCILWTQELANKLNEVYLDESHCLVAPEIRSEKDKPVSCYCRDALVDARYMYQTYLATGRDPNLSGAYLGVQENVSRLCGDAFDWFKAAEDRDWRWNGPEVTRTFPPESEISRLRSDSRRVREVAYKVKLLYRGPGGGVTKVENFIAFERERTRDVK